MLDPQSRHLFLAALHPPPACRLDWAVGTTYSLDLLAVLAAPIAFAFSDWDGADRPADAAAAVPLLAAVRRYADHVCVLYQAGRVVVPRAYSQLLVNLEDSVVPVRPPAGGSFHPKAWFLRFVAADGSVLYRVLVLSRNLTFDRSWDTLLQLDGDLGKANVARNRPLAEFVAALPDMTVAPLAATWAERFVALANELRRVKFETPPPFDDFTFHPLGVGGRRASPLAGRVDRLLVVSPFVDAAFLQQVADLGVPTQLVSRPESLDELPPAALEPFDPVRVLDADPDPEPEDPAGGEAVPLAGLHAKVYVADAGWGAYVWTGSANATAAGFGRNVELMVQLTGKQSVCGVEAALGKPDGKWAGLAALLQPYRPGGSPADADRRAFERAAARYATALAAAAAAAHCTPAGDAFAVDVRGPAVPPPAGWAVRAWPISLSDAAARLLDSAAASWVRFDAVSFAALTPFFAVEAADPADRRRRFVLAAPLVGAPPYRREHVLRSLLSDPGRVLRFLLLLLADHAAAAFAALAGPAGDPAAGAAAGGPFEEPLGESLLKALARDPARIDAMAEVVRDLEQTAEGRALLPPGFDALWPAVWAARRRTRETGGTADAR